jgi:hypothetical protein
VLKVLYVEDHPSNVRLVQRLVPLDLVLLDLGAARLARSRSQAS